MNKIMTVALAIALSAGATAAFAEAGPDLGKPFGSRDYNAPAPSLATGGPVASDADAAARLRADGYRGIDGLTRGSDGAWHGTAIHGAAKVNVIVAPDGRIFAR